MRQYVRWNIWRWFMFGITTPFVFIRLYIQFSTRQHRRRETFLIISWLLFLGCCIGETITSPFIYPSPNWTIDFALHVLSELLKWRYAWSALYLPSVYCCKALLLLLYTDLCGPKDGKRFRKVRWLIAFTWVNIVIAMLELTLSTLLACRPLSLNWNATKSTCKVKPWITLVPWSMHMWTDGLVYLIPFLILRKLHKTRKRKKLPAFLMFGFGFLNIATATVLMIRIVALIYYPAINDQDGWSRLDAPTQYLTPFQHMSAITIVCLPQTKQFWRKIISKRKRKAGIVIQPSEAFDRRPPPLPRLGGMAGWDEETVLASDGLEDQSQKTRLSVEKEK